MSESEIDFKTIQGKIIGVLLASLILALGVWIISMGLEGQTPVKPLAKRDVPWFTAVGVLFTWGGILPLVMVFLGGRQPPRWLNLTLFSVFIVCLAAPFLLMGAFAPESINTTVSLNHRIISHSKGGSGKAIGFISIGVLLLVSLPFLIRWLFPKKRKKPNGDNSSEPPPECDVANRAAHEE
jgi:hypothetical protein